MVAQQFPQAVLLRNTDNLGFARANNQALRISRGEYSLLLNSDACLQPHALDTMIRFLDATPRAGVVGGGLFAPSGNAQSSYARFPGLLDEIIMLSALQRWPLRLLGAAAAIIPGHEPHEVDWVCGAFLMVRRAAVDSVGLLDEAYFMYSEEMDWCFRIRQQGWSVWHVPSACAVHHEGGTSRRVPERKRAQLYCSKWLFMRKHRGEARARLFHASIRVLSGIKMLVWFIASLDRRADCRRYAREQVASYRHLLATL